MSRSAAYLHGHGASVVAAHAARTATDAAAFLLPRLKSPMRVLDIGCGPGTITVGLADAVAPSGTVLGLDMSESLGSEWDKRLAESECGNLEFVNGDLFTAELPNDAFDIVYMHQVLQHLPNPVDALRAATSYAKDGALVAVREVDWGTFAVHPNTELMREFRRIYDAVAVATGGNPRAGRRLLAWCNEAGGLEDVQITTSTWTFYDDAGKDWWGNQWAARVLESNIAASALDRGIATRSELEAISEEWLRWRKLPDAVSAFVHFEALAKVRK